MRVTLYEKDGIVAEELYYKDMRLVRVMNNKGDTVFIDIGDFRGKLEPGMCEYYPREHNGKLLNFEEMAVSEG